MFKCVMAIVTVLAVVAVGGLLRLIGLPFRAVRGLFRHNARPANVTAP